MLQLLAICGWGSAILEPISHEVTVCTALELGLILQPKLSRILGLDCALNLIKVGVEHGTNIGTLSL